MSPSRPKSAQVLSKKTILRIHAATLVECQIQTPTQRLTRYSIEHPGCVVMIPQLGPDQFLLVRQYRYAARGWLWEFPAGGVEKGETLRQAARRELKEEVGYDAKLLKKLVSFYPTPGISEEKMHLFLAQKMIPAFAEKDDDEEFQIRAFCLGEIGWLIDRGKIEDAKTIIGYFYLLRLRNQL